MLSFRDLPNPEIEPASLTSPALAGEFFTIGAEEGKKQITQTELTPSCTFNELWTTYLVTMEITYQWPSRPPGWINTRPG